LIFLCNTARQLELFVDNNIESVFCSNNCFVDERLFFPIPDAEKSIDAVYDGRLADWKRHELAASIDSLGLIYYALPWHEDNSYMRGLIQRFEAARFFNHDAAGAYRRLTPGEVNAALNTCRVGLCLSAEEGAMYACVQYLLAGLPVVTTPSVGGRDIFFDDEIAITAEPTPQAIGDAVREMIGRGLEAEYIRGKTLERLKVHRGYFVDLVQAIYDKHGVSRNFGGEWPNIFHNKMLRNLNHSETARQLNLGGRA